MAYIFLYISIIKSAYLFRKDEDYSSFTEFYWYMYNIYNIHIHIFYIEYDYLCNIKYMLLHGHTGSTISWGKDVFMCLFVASKDINIV